MSFLKNVRFNWEKAKNRNIFPFNISSMQNLHEIELPGNVTFFVGENGSGKSTLLEAIASKCEFSLLGGGRAALLDGSKDKHKLEEIITLSWMPKVKEGFFLRAETFYDFANYIDELALDNPGLAYLPYGGKSLHHQSHGEAFISLFMNRFNGRGIYLLDEPEAALSPQRQLAFLSIMKQLVDSGNAQFIIATHSPILMAYPEATIYNFDQAPLQVIEYKDTEHFFITKRFLNDRESFFKDLFNVE